MNWHSNSLSLPKKLDANESKNKIQKPSGTVSGELIYYPYKAHSLILTDRNFSKFDLKKNSIDCKQTEYFKY